MALHINNSEFTLKIYPVLLAGGTGTRLWPISTKAKPKQFVSLFGNLSLFQITIKRFTKNKYIQFNDPLIVTNKKYSSIVSSQMQDLGINDYHILEEPAVRDTGPAIALATEYILQKDPDATIILIPADHYMPKPDQFFKLIEKGLFQIQDNIIIFGIKPTRSETGYGYIHKGFDLGHDCYNVLEFKEKPDKQTAIEYLESGEYFWNSGIYLFKAQTLMQAFKNHCPEVYYPIKYIYDENRILDINNFKNIPSISIDYAITEKSSNVIMVDSPIEWSDVGSWEGLWEISQKDDNGNYHHGNVITVNSTNNLVRGNKRIVTIGLSNIAIVETKDTILVINKDESQEVKNVAKSLDIL